MSVSLQEFAARLDEELRTDAYADLDASENGLQVAPDDRDVDHAAFAVDAALATIEEATGLGADVLVTHHGLSWGGIDRITGRQYHRIAPLVLHDTALYVSHLPLDGHQELGNAAGVADHLGLERTEPFGELGAEHVGQRGRLPEGRSVAELRHDLNSLPTGDREVQVLPFGPDEVREVAVLTGSGTDWFDEAVAVGVDAFVTGEGKQKLYHQAREAGVNVFLAGHYATEVFGVRALKSLVERWEEDVETTYIDHPTGL